MVGLYLPMLSYSGDLMTLSSPLHSHTCSTPVVPTTTTTTMLTLHHKTTPVRHLLLPCQQQYHCATYTITFLDFLMQTCRNLCHQVPLRQFTSAGVHHQYFVPHHYTLYLPSPKPLPSTKSLSLPPQTYHCF